MRAALPWPRALPSQPWVFPAPGAPLVSEGGRSLWAQIWSTNPSAPNSSGPSCPPPETLDLPQLTPEKSGISSRVGLGQRHLVLSLVQDGGEHTAEGPGAVLRGRVRGQRAWLGGWIWARNPSVVPRPPQVPCFRSCTCSGHGTRWRAGPHESEPPAREGEGRHAPSCTAPAAPTPGSCHRPSSGSLPARSPGSRAAWRRWRRTCAPRPAPR